MNEQRSKLNAYWTEVITDFISSGLSQKAYAQQKNLKVYSLGFWYRKYNTGFSGFVHIENKNLYYLNSDYFDLIPDYILNECEKIIALSTTD